MSVAAQKTVSILFTLGILPSGKAGPALNTNELSAYLKAQLDTQEEKARNDRHTVRDQMYRDGGVSTMEKVIEDQFTDDVVRGLRKKWVKHARFNNAMKRIVNELSTVYAQPATRSVAGDANQARYKAVLDQVMMDEQMLQFGRLLNLHRAMLLGFRVRVRPDGSLLTDGTPGGPREAVLEMASPANVRAVLHPNDRTLVLGWVIKTDCRPARQDDVNFAAWTLWTDFERVQLRADFSVIPETYLEHGLGVCPWIGVTLGPPCAGFWPGEDGEDLVAAHIAIWFSNVLMLKETKSATKMPVITGDGTTMARGQSADTEVPAELAEGQGLTTVDMSMDLSMFRDGSDHVLRNTAQNYGIAPGMMTHQGVQSAAARELMRMPVNEVRSQQQHPLRRAELALVFVMTCVLARDWEAAAFTMDGWTMKFGDPTTPLARGDRVNLFIAERQNGLANTVDFIAQEEGISPDQATGVLERNIQLETERAVLMRPFAAISGAMPTTLVAPEEVDKVSPDSSSEED